MATHESGASFEQKRKILEASEEDTVPTPIFTGRNVRVLKSPELEQWFRRQREGATAQELEDLANQIKRKRRTSSEVSVTAGQISGMITEIESAEEVITRLIEEATGICLSLGSLADAE